MAKVDKKKQSSLEVAKNILKGRISLPEGVSLRFIFFLFALAFLYITNHLEAEKRIRRIADLSTEIKDLNYEQITTQSELMNMSKQSEILRRTEADGLELQELTEPPRIIER